MKILLFVFYVLLPVFAILPTQANIVVVVAKHSVIEQLEDVDVANIFLARTKRFPNGDKTLPLELDESAVRESFYYSISGKNPKQLMAYWTTLVFTGKGRPPKRFNHQQELLEYLTAEAGAITYIDQQFVTKDMKIVYSFP